MKGFKLITVPEIAEKHGKDQSYVNKLVKKEGYPVVKAKRGSDGKVVNAINLSDYDKMLADYPHFTAKEVGMNDVPVLEVSKLMGVDPKTVRTIAKSLGIEYKEKKIDGRSRKVVTKSEANRIQKERKEVVVLTA
jgi:hypothetical protein